MAQRWYEPFYIPFGEQSRADEVRIDGPPVDTGNPVLQVGQVPTFGDGSYLNTIAMRNAHNFFPVTNICPVTDVALSVKPNYDRRYTVLPIPSLGLDALREYGDDQ